jgi:HAD superfamily hydrolase (TIGR01484 family)
MGAYKLIALDMDGTLLDDEQRISLENRKWINNAVEAGINVCFSTGRGIQDVLPYGVDLNLKTPIVTVNGSEVWEKPNVLLNRYFLETKWVERMHQLAVEHDAFYWGFTVEGLHRKDHWHVNLKSSEWLKFGLHTGNDESRNAIYEEIASWDVIEITNSHPLNIECNPKGINKASGLQEVCTLLGIQMSEVVAIGDSLNDVAMIRASGLGVAMGNAQDEVKKIADMVTAANNEDGVAKVIQNYVLK